MSLNAFALIILAGLIHAVWNIAAKKAGGDAFNYLNTRNWGNDTVNELLAWMQDNQATGEDGAHHFLKNYPQIWGEWVTPEVAERIKAAL